MAGKKHPPKKLRAGDFSALSVFLRGYLHQDFRAEYATPEAALAAYCREASRDEVGALAREWERFHDLTAKLPFAETQTFFCDSLGSAWQPQNRADLDAFRAILKNSAL